MASIPQTYRFERYQMQGHIREFSCMFSDKRKKVREHYKEYNGGYLGHYAKLVIVFLQPRLLRFLCLYCRADRESLTDVKNEQPPDLRLAL